MGNFVLERNIPRPYAVLSPGQTTSDRLTGRYLVYVDRHSYITRVVVE
jgi:hypothetical protein